MNVFGIDVSVNNGHVNWDMVKMDPQGIQFSFIKATQGVGYADPNRFLNAYGASHAGIKFGYYHFSSLNSVDVEADAKAEANWFRKTIKEMPVPSLPCVLDIETDEINLTSDRVQLWISSFIMDMINNGYPKMMIYSGTYFLNTHLPSTHPFGHVPLWLAQYARGFNVPHGWDKVKVWQYTCKGKVMGIQTDVDMNRCDDLNF